MTKQVWGTFSVKDHCELNAFLAEVMLYDRLVIPIPPDGAERERWTSNGWNPDRLDQLLEILDDRAYPIPWDIGRRESWKERYVAGKSLAQDAGDWAFVASRTELTSGLPRNVTGVQVVTSYPTVDDMQRELDLRSPVAPLKEFDQGAAIAIIGHEFLVPNDPKCSPDDLLRQAVELSSDKSAARKRAAFWRWQREFFADKGIADQAALLAAVDELNELLKEQKASIRRKRVKTGLQYGFLAGSITIGLLAGPLTPIALGGAFLSLGQFAADKLQATKEQDAPSPVSLVHDRRKQFGWR